ncbi:hypothetical protein TNCV_4515501 [Trichonephila clavipes]|nr:hypothetical protein TNCV_4515501 [Trichonephila clavipes]
MDDYGQNPHRIQTAQDYEWLSVRLLRSRQFFFSTIKTWTAVREPGACEFLDFDIDIIYIYLLKFLFSIHSSFVNLKEGRSDGRSPVPRDCNCNFYICPVVYKERNFLGASLTPPKRVTRSHPWKKALHP